MYSYILSIRGQIGCLCILVYIAWTYFSVRRRKTVAHTLFSALNIFSILNLIFDMVTVYSVNHNREISMFVNRIYHVIFVSTVTSILFIIYMYIRSLAYGDFHFRKHWLIPWVVSLLAVTFLPFEIAESPYGNYSSGSFLTVAFVCAYTYFFLGFFILVAKRKEIEKKSVLAIFLSLIAIISVTILQGIFPELLITSIGITIVNVALYYTVESPDALLIEELAEERLKAESANEAKSLFLAQMSHEIRTPINAILGMNEMILREADDKTKEYSLNVAEAGKTLLALVNSILDFSKIEDGKMEIMSVPYDVSSMINNLVHSIHERAVSKGLELNVRIDEKIPSELIGDDVRLSQVIMNLLTNAVKYTPRGEIDLIMKVAERIENNIELYVEVKDTGIGIKEEDIDKLFASFTRIEEKRNRNIEGTGLGMSIVSRLLDMMGSKINVESTYGEGSSFSFTIKQGISDPTPIGNIEDRIKKSRSKIAKKVAFKAPEARILIVDDNSMNLKVAGNLLGLYGIKPDLAGSGAEAISLMKERHYDIVCMDHMMPEMDGIETYNRLKEDNLIPENTVMLMMTANAVVGAREEYLQIGFDDYISKPIEIEKMEEKLVTYLPKDIVKPADDEPSVKESKVKAAVKEDDEVLEFAPGGDDEVMEFGPEDGFNDDSADEALMDAMKELGIDADTGLMHCGASMEFYKEILSDSVEQANEKADALTGFLDADDLKNYRTAVHALKSNLRNIGEKTISKKAEMLEKAAGGGDEETVKNDHVKMISDYLALMEKIGEKIEK